MESRILWISVAIKCGKFCEAWVNLKEELNLKMVDHNSKADFNGMSVAEFKKYQQEQEISAGEYL